jgi:tRNA (mo5U34)-methyltransferase
MNLFNFSDFDLAIDGNKHLKKWQPHFASAIDKALKKPNGNLERWLSAFNDLPDRHTSYRNLTSAEVTLGKGQELSNRQLQTLQTSLKILTPWRKGPYNLFGISIDSEWRSNLKWERALPHLPEIQGRTILDVGCGNGYYMYRMLGEKAKLVVGVDPSFLFFTQFQSIKKFSPELQTYLLPIGVEDVPETKGFDTVFAMGVFYHRRSPFDFLRKLKSFLRDGGDLVLETLVVEGDERTVLVPAERYACMRNVYFIPSTLAMTNWLVKAGFKDIKVVDVAVTTLKEQRQTEWMTWESLNQFLDKNNPGQTIEGYPAPTRAFFTARV